MHLFKGNIVLDAVNNLFLNTHIARDNYFYYGYIYGQYTPQCCPRYLQPQHFAALKDSVGRIDIQTGTLQDVASRYADGFFSRYILLDHMDWMPMSMVRGAAPLHSRSRRGALPLPPAPPQVLDEWSVFVTKARADCRILWRSYSVDQHIAPLKYLEFHERESAGEGHGRVPWTQQATLHARV